MAHSFHSVPGSGNGYPAFPFYSSFPPNPSQQLHTNSPGYQQITALHSNQPTPTPLPNGMRYESNAHINPQSAPLPFPPNLNPDSFRHFPPPPPPPLNFSTGSGTPTSFSHFLQTMSNGSQAYAQPLYPGFPQSHPAMNGHMPQMQGTPSLGVAPGLPITTSHPESVTDVIEIDNQYEGAQAESHTAPDSVSHNGNSNYSSQVTYTATQNQSQPPQYSPDKSQQVTQPEDIQEGQLPGISSRSPPRQRDSVIRPQEVPLPPAQQAISSIPRLKLKESAKAAILSFVPHKITYANLLEEGVNPEVLQQLYTELGLNWKPTSPPLGQNSQKPQQDAIQGIHESVKTNTFQPNSMSQPVVSKTSANSSAKISSGGTQALSSVSTINPGLERKDRIAQLLAAKTGKASPAGAASQSGLPNTTTESSPPLKSIATKSIATLSDGATNAAVVDSSTVKPVKTMAQTSLVRQKMEQLKKETADKIKASVNLQANHDTVVLSDQLTTTQSSRDINVQLSSLPTPVKESLVQSGISSLIPGLFMTSADEDFVNDTPTAHSESGFADQALSSSEENVMPEDVSSTSNASLKRPITEESGEEDRHRAKRPSLSKDTSVDVEMEIDGPGFRSGQDHDESSSEGEIIEDEARPTPSLAMASPNVYHNLADHGQRYENVNKQDRGLGPANFGHLPNSRDLSNNNTTNSHPIGLHNMYTKASDAELRKGINPKQSIVASPPVSSPTTPVGIQQMQVPPMPSQSKLQNLDQVVTNDRAVQSSRTLTKLTPAQLAEKAAQLKADFIRQRALRQKQLVEDMPALNDEVQRTKRRLEQNKSKLAELQLQLKQREAEIAGMRKTEIELITEIRSLELQLQDSVSGQKQFSNELNEIKQQAASEAVNDNTVDNQLDTQHRLPTDVLEGTSHSSIVKKTILEADNLEGAIKMKPREQDMSRLDHAAVPIHDSVVRVAMKDGVALSALSSLAIRDPSVTESFRSGEQHDNSDTNDNSTRQSNDTDNERVAEETPSLIGAPASTQSEQYQSEDDEPMDQSDEDLEVTPMSVDQATSESVSMDGSASMFDSDDSEDYEPASPEPQQNLGQQITDSDFYEPQDEATNIDQAITEEAVDDYEPSENVEIVNPVVATVDRQDTLIPAIGDSIQKRPHESSFNQDHNEPQPSISEIKQASKVDDQENGLQLSEANTLTKPQGTSDTLGSDVQINPDGSFTAATRFAPYQSPLSSFKSYRFNSSFASRVKNGYRSLTYSNKIDPKTPICPAELSGEACTDPGCQEQHFGSMALSDDKILVQMSSANDIKDKGLRDQYLLGLKQVIARLRQEGVKEFSSVADALSKHRREWAASQMGV